MYALGYDIGSSSIKAALVDVNTGKTIHITQYPKTEMEMIAHQEGWAEQDPEVWWQAVIKSTNELLAHGDIDNKDITSIGISYQMHGLVCVDKDQNVLRPSIIWCDSRAVGIGDEALTDLGDDYCLGHLLNSPGNFTASKLKWVQEHEPEVFAKIDKVMLPGDYIAMKLTGEISTTISGLSEGMMWDFQEQAVATRLLDHYGIPTSMIPEISSTFSIQGKTSSSGSKQTGIAEGTLVTYRAGDQPNNALSLGVFEPGQVAATGGTSGVVYGISDQLAYDAQSRVNGFAHVNHTNDTNRIGQLLCINGAGSQYAWTRQQIAAAGISYPQMEAEIAEINVGSDGLYLLPFGNGAERMLNNKLIGAQMSNIQFNIHSRSHMYRAALEGIAFSFVYGIAVLKDLGIDPSTMRVGNDNLFQSEVFSMTIANLLGSQIDMIDTTGAVGAAKASAVATGHFSSPSEAIASTQPIKTYHPDSSENSAYVEAYENWKTYLTKALS